LSNPFSLFRQRFFERPHLEREKGLFDYGPLLRFDRWMKGIKDLRCSGKKMRWEKKPANTMKKLRTTFSAVESKFHYKDKFSQKFVCYPHRHAGDVGCILHFDVKCTLEIACAISNTIKKPGKVTCLVIEDGI